MSCYFFDTYAIIELIKGNLGYLKYSEEKIILTQLNLIELYYSLINNFTKEMASMIYHKFKESVVEIDDDTIFDAMQLKRTQKNLSYADCIGYAYSKRNKLKFLTGDREFKNMQGVEFVK